MTAEMRLTVLVASAVLLISGLAGDAVSQVRSNGLATAESFARIEDPAQRSVALFIELGKVLTNPRCLNCHPAGDRPRQQQGALRRLHQPPVERGADGRGLPGMRCNICHQQANFDPGRMPGHPEWHLAPPEMGWEGKSLAEICRQIKDPERNGGRSLEKLVEHIGSDTLVGWAWHPGFGREPAPGTQRQAGALVAAWVKTGAVCPD